MMKTFYCHFELTFCRVAGVSPFARYGSPFASPFSGLSPYVREMPMGGPIHDPWRKYVVQIRCVSVFFNL